VISREQGHEAKAVFEEALDRAGWPYTVGKSRWLDGLTLLSEEATSS